MTGLKGVDGGQSDGVQEAREQFSETVIDGDTLFFHLSWTSGSVLVLIIIIIKLPVKSNREMQFPFQSNWGKRQQRIKSRCGEFARNGQCKQFELNYELQQ